MFNFFEEMATMYGINLGKYNSFNLVNIANKLVYVEGQKGIIKITPQCITFKVKGSVISVFGQNLKLKRISENVLVIQGEIKQVESGI